MKTEEWLTILSFMMVGHALGQENTTKLGALGNCFAIS
jgi:hypothetical protein